MRPRCGAVGRQVSGKPLKEMKEPSYFFRLGKFQKRLIQHIQDNPEFIAPAARRNEVRRRTAPRTHARRTAPPRQQTPPPIETTSWLQRHHSLLIASLTTLTTHAHSLTLATATRAGARPPRG
jgi:hypothetical protein